MVAADLQGHKATELYGFHGIFSRRDYSKSRNEETDLVCDRMEESVVETDVCEDGDWEE